jgi:hypothetical protein
MLGIEHGSSFAAAAAKRWPQAKDEGPRTKDKAVWLTTRTPLARVKKCLLDTSF